MMNYNKTIARALCVLFSFYAFTACVNNLPEEIEPDGPVSELNIRTRTGSSDIPPTLPIHIYAFNSSGKCAAQQTLTSADEIIALELIAGTYNVYALTGASEERYNLPDISEVAPEDIISLKEGFTTHAELEAGNAEITLAEGVTTNLNLTVSRVIAQVTACLSELPDEVTAVSIALEPLYQQLKLDGTYGSQTGSTSFSLTKDSKGDWITTEPVFVLPGKGNTTVSINLTTSENTHKYAYNSNIQVTANYKVNIQATYTEAYGPDINGSIQSTDWAGVQEINFDFGPGGTSGNNDKVTELPAVGSLYKECYVLAVTDVTDISANLLLVAPQEWKDLTIDNFESALNAYTINELSGWGLPNLSQAKMLFKARKSIEGIDQNADYLFSDGDILKAFPMDDISFEDITASKGMTFHARVVKVQPVSL